jgi:hypothetical protein
MWKMCETDFTDNLIAGGKSQSQKNWVTDEDRDA